MSIGQEYEFIIQWHLTERSNLRCTHCYQEGSRGGELVLDEIRSGLDEIQDLLSAWSKAHGLTFAPSFNITGGEPLLRNDLFHILGDIADRRWDAYVLTNGTLVNPAIARRFAGLGVKGVQVSLDGPEEIHDTFRGAGSYQASLSGIRSLLREGVPVTVNTTLSEINAEPSGLSGGALITGRVTGVSTSTTSSTLGVTSPLTASPTTALTSTTSLKVTVDGTQISSSVVNVRSSRPFL